MPWKLETHFISERGSAISAEFTFTFGDSGDLCDLKYINAIIFLRFLLFESNKSLSQQ